MFLSHIQRLVNYVIILLHGTRQALIIRIQISRLQVLIHQLHVFSVMQADTPVRQRSVMPAIKMIISNHLTQAIPVWDYRRPAKHVILQIQGGLLLHSRYITIFISWLVRIYRSITVQTVTRATMLILLIPVWDVIHRIITVQQIRRIRRLDFLKTV